MRKLSIVLLCCTVIGLAGYAGYRSYVVWRQKRLLTMAREFYAKADNKNTLFSLRLALTANPKNVQAARLAAEVLDAEGSHEALLWRARVVELNPKSGDDRLALANTAMKFQDYSAATDALEGVGENDKMTAVYQNTAGALAVATQRFPEAKAHFLEAVRLEPGNPALQLNLSMVDIRGTNEAAVAEARATLRRLSLSPTNAPLRYQALRELVVDAMRCKREDLALSLSGELVQRTDAAFADRLLRLEVLRDTHDVGFSAAMLGLQGEASTNSGNLYTFAVWQQSHGALQEGLTWLQGLSPDLRTNQPAALLIAEFHAMLKDWPGLQQCLDHQDWAGAEFIRHALLARALRGEELPDSSRGEWERALKAAGDQKIGRTMLLNLASQWGWQNETEELLWTIVSRYPEERWADQTLTQILFTSGRTRSLLALFSQEVKMRPSDLASKHNLAVTALLLDAAEYKPHDLAREVHEKAPANSAFAATYAYSLLIQKKNAQALTVIEEIKPSDLENPLIAGYYAIILQANGNRAKAKKYLDLSDKSMHLPEEQKLFDLAKTSG